MMRERLRFYLRRVNERLWVKPLVVCIVSIAAVFLARLLDTTVVGGWVPEITQDSLDSLLGTLSESMLVMAIFAVASMVAAYASAGSTATPRTFPLVIADDVSQNALSTFIGAFIFSIVASTALQNGIYDKASRFALFVLTVVVFATVIVMFLRWVDQIARLGRLGTTIDRAEAATAEVFRRRCAAPTLRGMPIESGAPRGRAVLGRSVGYVQRVDVETLQKCAERCGMRIAVASLPGAFSTLDRPLAWLIPDSDSDSDAEVDLDEIAQAFVIGDARTFDEDPRFGLVVLSEIAGRALSPGVNDPGTAIDVTGTLVRLFTIWVEPRESADDSQTFDRVQVPEISIRDMFDDAFTAIARDGAGSLEVAVRLQKALASLSRLGDEAMRQAAVAHSRLALERAERALVLESDKQELRRVAAWASPDAAAGRTS